ncbi:TPA: DnaB-like helicase C-terminal domain-containing protein [Klebsiella pneumoniae]
MSEDTSVLHTGKPLSEEFNDDFQNRLAAYFCRDFQFISRAGDLVEPDQFSSAANGFLVDLVGSYFKMYRSIPSTKVLVELVLQANKKGRIRAELMPDIKAAIARCIKEPLTDTNYMVDKVATFARSCAFDDALIKAATLKEKGEFEKAMVVMNKVNMVGASGADDVYDYLAREEERLAARDFEASDDYVPNSIPTGVRILDKTLYQKGWGRREMVLIMGFAKAGKSTAMGEFAVNAILAGYNALYVSLEVHTSILSDRFDARLSELPMEKLTERRDEVHRKLRDIGADGKLGSLWIVERPSGSFSPADLDRLIDSMGASGKKVDMVVVDYADLMRATNPSKDDRVDVKNIYTDLRAVFDKHNVAGMTASQTNRDGGSAETATMMHAADNIEKVRIADLIISINKTEEEAEKGEARLFFAGSRNQKGGFALRVQQDLEQMRFIKSVLGVI